MNAERASGLLTASQASSVPVEALAEDHPTAVAYLDESGVIKADPFFGIGCLKTTDGPALTRALHRHRQRLECMQELHWSRFDKAMSRADKSFDLAIAAIDTFFDLEGASFCCMLADRQNGDLTRSYRSSSHAYEGLSSKVLAAAIAENEVVSVVADHIDTPAHVRFEDTVKGTVNVERGRLAVATVIRAHSHAVDGLQLADLLLGAAMFDFRQGAARGALDTKSQKGQLCGYLLDRCDIPSFRPRGREVPGKFRVELRTRKRTRRGRRGGDGS